MCKRCSVSAAAFGTCDPSAGDERPVDVTASSNEARSASTRPMPVSEPGCRQPGGRTPGRFEQPAPLGCRGLGEGWAGGPSRRDAKRPSGDPLQPTHSAGGEAASGSQDLPAGRMGRAAVLIAGPHPVPQTLSQCPVGAGLLWQGRETDVRAESFRRLVSPLLDRGVQRLIIESRQGGDQGDRQVLIEELRRLARAQPLRYVHLPPHGDPRLWVADALAWSHSAGGTWRARIADITTAEDVSAP